MTQAHIDDIALNELKEMLEDEFHDLITTYISDTQTKLESLSEKLDQSLNEEVRKLAHSVKGSSINIGIHKLSSICSELEQAAVAGDLVLCGTLYADAKQEFDQVLTILNEEYV